MSTISSPYNYAMASMTAQKSSIRSREEYIRMNTGSWSSLLGAMDDNLNVSGIDEKKEFKGIPGSVKPVAIMESLERVEGASISNRIKMFVK